MEKQNTRISVIIPLYNEEKTIKNILENIPNSQKYEIILVDDGSTDKSIKRAKDINNRKIKIIEHKENQGYGAALLSGFKNAKGDIIITMDSDGQHNPEEIPNLIKPIVNNKADIVVGSRYLGECKYKIPPYTRFGEFMVKLCLWALYYQSVGNNQSGFRAFNKKTLKIFNSIRFTKFGFNTEILFKAAYNKFKIKEVPISINPRMYGSSYVILNRIIIPIMSAIFLYTIKRFKLLRFFNKKSKKSN
jgi:glycosyltransferase involved in cell wall biosynthesis